MKKINIKGVIISNDLQWIYDWFEIEATSPKKVEAQMADANGEDLEVIINSGGGEVFAGSEIYTILKDYPGNITVKVVGIAASAASVIAMAGNKVLMSPTAQMMIHNASIIAKGDYRDMEHAAGVLKNVNQTIVNAYRLKSGMDEKTLFKMMDDESWLTPQQALEHKFIDEIMFDGQFQLVASVMNPQMLPQQVINKIRNEFKAGDNLPTKNWKEIISEEEESVMNLEELKAKHPELYDLVRQEGHIEGVKAGVDQERYRMQAIDELAMPGNEELVNKAKYETGATAEQLAIELVKAEKQRGTNFLNQRKQDAENLKDVEGSAPKDKEEDKEQIEAAAKEIAEAANRKRGIR